MGKAFTYSEWLRVCTLRLARLHYWYIAALAAQVIVYDSWKLITPESVLQRWIMVAVALIAVTVIWYLAHSFDKQPTIYKKLLFALVVLDISIASFSVYTQRGMASRAVLLFLIPIIISAATLTRPAIFATAVICVAAYTTSAVSYFVLHFNEGYKIELYGEVGFYSLMFLLVAALLGNLVRFKE